MGAVEVGGTFVEGEVLRDAIGHVLGARQSPPEVSTAPPKALVDADPGQPRPRLVLGANLVPGPPGQDRGLLHRVLGLVRISQDGEGDPEEAALLPREGAGELDLACSGVDVRQGELQTDHTCIEAAEKDLLYMGPKVAAATDGARPTPINRRSAVPVS